MFILVAVHKDPQDIPEEEGYTGKKPERCSDILIRIVVMNDVAGAVEDRSGSENNHGH